MMRAAAWRLTALWLVGGCATVQAPVLGSSPQLVAIDIGSELRFEPQLPEVLADPAVRGLVEQCEQQGFSRCRQRIAGIETRTRFARPRETMVVALISLKGLEAGRRYEVRFRLFDPKGEMRARATWGYDLPRHLPANFELQVHFTWSPPDPLNWDLGRWRVEIAVNGNVEGERTFQVVEWGAANDSTPPEQSAPRVAREHRGVAMIVAAIYARTSTGR